MSGEEAFRDKEEDVQRNRRAKTCRTQCERQESRWRISLKQVSVTGGRDTGNGCDS